MNAHIELSLIGGGGGDADLAREKKKYFRISKHEMVRKCDLCCD